MTALPTPTQHDHDQDRAARRATDRAFDALNPDFDIRADSGDAWQRLYVQVNEDLFLRGQRVAVAELQENDQEPDYRTSVVHQRAVLARERAAEQAFDRLNPSIAADHCIDPGDRHSLRVLEDGLTRGWAVVLAEHHENSGPTHWRQQHIRWRAARADRPPPTSGRARRARLYQPEERER